MLFLMLNLWVSDPDVRAKVERERNVTSSGYYRNLTNALKTILKKKR